MTISRRWIDRLSMLLLVVAAIPVSYRFVPQARALMLSAAGRNPVCPLPLAMRSQAMIDEHDAVMAKIAAGSKKLREDGKLEQWQTPHGDIWIPKESTSDLGGVPIFSILAESERRIYGHGETGVKKGDIVIDGGAHVGTFTRQSLKDGASLVVAVEPSPKNIECLRRNFANEIAEGRVIVYTKGIWDEESKMKFHQDADSTSRDSVVEGAAQPGDLEIDVTTIDKIQKELKLARVDFIKMDIEGAERRALAGAKSVIASYKPRLAICAYHLPDDPKVLPALIASLNPAYRFQCGPCGETESRIVPHTLLYH